MESLHKRSGSFLIDSIRKTTIYSTRIGTIHLAILRDSSFETIKPKDRAITFNVEESINVGKIQVLVYGI